MACCCIASNPLTRGDVWGGVPETLRPLYTITMLLAAAVSAATLGALLLVLVLAAGLASIIGHRVFASVPPTSGTVWARYYIDGAIAALPDIAREPGDVAIAVGASQTYYGFYPPAFDEAFAERGRPTGAETEQNRDKRYPRIDLDEVERRAPDILLLPDEPYEFGPADIELFRAQDTPAARRGAGRQGDEEDREEQAGGHRLRRLPGRTCRAMGRSEFHPALEDRLSPGLGQSGRPTVREPARRVRSPRKC